MLVEPGGEPSSGGDVVGTEIGRADIEKPHPRRTELSVATFSIACTERVGPVAVGAVVDDDPVAALVVATPGDVVVPVAAIAT